MQATAESIEYDFTDEALEYQTRQWAVYHFANDVSDELRTIGLQQPPYDYNATDRYLALTTFRGKRFGKTTNEGSGITFHPFFRDLEIQAAGLDGYAGAASAGVLLEDWNGHPKGALVYMVFGPHQNRINTFMVEVR